jgi:IPT/TIG domain
MAQLFHFHSPSQTQPPKPIALPTPRSARTTRYFLYGVAVALLLIALVEFARAGGPEYVAGVSYFNTGLAGQPITWPGGAIIYYTDQGNLSPQLPGPSADAFVADAFTRWTGIPTAAVSATRAGQLAEDVSGANVILNSNPTVTLPADIQPTATGTPVGIVYDLDGTVTDALLGTGASGDCVMNSAFGGPDNLTVDGHFAHALVVMNGLCAQTSAELPDMKYHLVRVLGQVFGLGWSQLNLNVITGSPIPTADDKAGFPVMHALDQSNCVPVSLCYSNADQPKFDDQAAISRLYPVTSENLAQFPGKQVFAAATARIHGSVRFTDANGNPAQPMQGVNVVARWINPSTGQPSTKYAASSVSGFLFCGNAGNAITGYDDPLSQPLDRFGSGDATLEGFFDLAGLPIPTGSSGRYQLTIEALDPMQSQAVGPYAPWQVQPSGTAQPITVTVALGGDAAQDILMQGSAIQSTDIGESSSYASPQPLPKSGTWIGNLSPYGDTEYFSVSGQAGHALVVDVSAFDESGKTTEQKAQPVIGIWSIADPAGTPPPALTPSAFNQMTAGVTRLNALLVGTGQFRIGIADLRGDGRPDYRYQARVLYGNTVEPNRVSVLGNTPLEVDGLGFTRGMQFTVGSTNAPLLAVSPDELIALAPAMADGTQSITLTDPATGASITMPSALTYGAGPNDLIRLTQGANPPTPVGGEAPYPIRVAVTSADGSTPVAGATVQWSANNGATLTVCGGASTCTVFTDDSGKAETRVDVGAQGTTTVTASLAPASYTPPKQVQAVVSGTASAADLSLFSSRLWVAQGATADVPLEARLLSNGVPVSGRTINFQIGIGPGSLSSGTAVTDGGGYARSTLHVSSLATDVQGTACLAPANNPCQTFYVVSVAASALRLEEVSGSLQAVSIGQGFQPVVARVADSSTPSNPVLGATVLFQTTLFLPVPDEPLENQGESSSSNHAMPVILGSSQSAMVSDGNGRVQLVPSTGGLNRALQVEIVAMAGANAQLQFELNALPPLAPITSGASTGVARVPPNSDGEERSVEVEGSGEPVVRDPDVREPGAREPVPKPRFPQER